MTFSCYTVSATSDDVVVPNSVFYRKQFTWTIDERCQSTFPFSDVNSVQKIDSIKERAKNVQQKRSGGSAAFSSSYTNLQELGQSEEPRLPPSAQESFISTTNKVVKCTYAVLKDPPG